jgi:TPR repeat protein
MHPKQEQYEKGHALCREGNFKDAVPLLTEAANSNHPKAIHTLAMFHLMETDPQMGALGASEEKAVELFKKGAYELKDPDCMIALGMCYCGYQAPGILPVDKQKGRGLINEAIATLGNDIDYMNCFWIAARYMQDADARSDISNVKIAVKLVERILNDKEYSDGLKKTVGPDVLEHCGMMLKMGKEILRN